MPGPVVLDGQRGPAAVGTDGHGDPAVGRAVADGVVDEDHHELPEASRIARSRPPAADRPRPGRRGPWRAWPAPRRRRPRRRRGRRAGVRARWRPSRSARAAAGPRRSRSCGGPRRRCPRARCRPRRPARSRWRDRCSTLLRMTVSGVRSSWLASAANSRWRRSAARWLVERLADRDERPPGVDGPEPEGDEDDDEAADEQDGQHHARASAARRSGPGRPGS